MRLANRILGLGVSLALGCSSGGGGSAGPENPCAEDPHATGCECDSSASPEPEICYSGPLETLGFGDCIAGLRVCDDDAWSACEGERLPGNEVCNDRDDDCDDAVDEELRSECGACTEDCRDQCVGIGCDDPFDAGADSALGVTLTESGGLTVEREPGDRQRVLWIPNTAEGTVSKIDTVRRVEVARYRTGPDGDGDAPSGIAVDSSGNVAVANAGGQVVRVEADGCIDADGDGVVETSNGAGDVRPWPEDECLTWWSLAGPGARASTFEDRIGLDGAREELLWTASEETSTIYELDARTGELTGNDVVPVQARDLVMGRDDFLWFVGSAAGLGGALFVFETPDPWHEVSPVGADAAESVTVDPRGRVWIGPTLRRYDRISEEPTTVETASGSAIACDASGDLFVGGSDGTWKVDGETLDVRPLGDVGGRAWSIDFDGFLWVVDSDGSSIRVYEPENLALQATVGGLVGVDTDSDLTGLELANGAPPAGSYAVVFDGCGDGFWTAWDELDWDADLPEGSSVSFAIAVPDRFDGDRWSYVGTIEGVAPPVDLAQALGFFVEGETLRVAITLEARDASPVLDTLRVHYGCTPL